MTNLPATQNTTLASLGGQAALFDRPDLILEWSDEFLQTVTANICATGDNVLSQLRRATGLVAWAAWHRFEDGEYGRFVDGIAKRLGFDRRTIDRWRDAVVEKEDLEKPQLALIRAAEAAKRREDARQRRSITTLSTDLAPEKVVLQATAKESDDPSSTAPPTVESPPADAPPGPAHNGATGDADLGSAGDGEAETTSDDRGDVPPDALTPHEWSPITPETVATFRERLRWQREDGNVHPNVFAAMVEHLLADRERPGAEVDVDAIGLRWLKSKTDGQVRAIGDPWGPAIRSEIGRWQTAYGRREGTVSRPEDRAKVKTERVADAPTVRISRPLAITPTLAKREVQPQWKAGKK